MTEEAARLHTERGGRSNFIYSVSFLFPCGSAVFALPHFLVYRCLSSVAEYLRFIINLFDV